MKEFHLGVVLVKHEPEPVEPEPEPMRVRELAYETFTACRVCGLEFRYSRRKPFCSSHCRWIEWDLKNALRAIERARESARDANLARGRRNAS